MAIGPFDPLAFPGVYTDTQNEPPRASAGAGLRVPAFIGVAEEVIPVTAWEMIRGHSALADNRIIKEDVTDTGITDISDPNYGRRYRVSYYPIVSGNGTGTTTNDPGKITAYVNEVPVPVASLDGANGYFYLISPTAVGDTVKVTYYYKEYDLKHTNEDLSLQSDGTNKTFKVDYLPIVEGNNGGTITTDPTKVTASITDGTRLFTVTAVDGNDGLITLSAVPSPSATVLFTYYSNEYQDTYDILPTNQVVNVTRLGYSASSNDFINDVDYALDTSGNFATVNWGNSAQIAVGVHTAGGAYFNGGTDGQVSTSIYDNRYFRRPVTKTADGTRKTFILEAIPTQGTSLGKTTDNPAKIFAYIGPNPTDATLAGTGTPAQPAVIEMSGANQTLTFATAPAADQTVYVTQYASKIIDDIWTLTDTTSGKPGVYTIGGASSGVAYNVDQSTVTTLATWQYPADPGSQFSDAQASPGRAIAETVTLTFLDATSVRYNVTSNKTSGTGSLGDNTGHINQTYVDAKTGFQVSIMQTSPNILANPFHANDTISYTVSPNIATSTNRILAIPGIKTTVTDTKGITVNDTAIITTYNKSGAEPNIGDFYYVSFNQEKNFNTDGLVDPVYVTLERDALAYTGPLSVQNKLGLAAHLAFLNGAPGVVLLQIQKTSGSADAPAARYIKAIDFFNQPMVGGLRPALMEPVTTSTDVLQYLKTSNTIQSSIRYANERMSYYGFAVGTSPSVAMGYAQGMNSERMIAIYPDGAIITMTDALNNSLDYLVDGSFLAAAVAGRDTIPSYDVAEPLDRKPVAGFTRLYRRPDPVTMSQVANAGITVLEELPAGVIIKMALTTDVSSALTRTPSIIRVKDSVQRGARSACGSYIGTKFLASRTTEIETTLKSYLSSLVKGQIINTFRDVKATPNPNDPSTVNVVVYYMPVFPLLWILITFNLRSA